MRAMHSVPRCREVTRLGTGQDVVRPKGSEDQYSFNLGNVTNAANLWLARDTSSVWRSRC